MPRAGLSTAVLVDEAARAADELGLEAVTLGVLARHFKVAVPSLYKHLDGLAGLRRALALRGIAALEVEMRAALGQGDPLVAMATAYRRFAREHPGLYAAIQRAPEPDDEEHHAAAARLVELFADQLAPNTKDPETRVDAVRTLRSALHGFCDLEARGGFGLPRDLDRSYEALVAGLGRALDAR